MTKNNTTRNGILMKLVIPIEDSPDGRQRLDIITKSEELASALFDIRQRVFRPARKHGYSDEKIQELVSRIPEATELIGLLEEEFNQILNYYDVIKFS